MKKIKIIFGFSTPRLAKEFELKPDTSTQELLRVTLTEFSSSVRAPHDSYGLFMVQSGTQAIIGDFEQLNLPPLEALEQIDEPDSFDLVVLLKTAAVDGGTGADDDDDEDDDDDDDDDDGDHVVVDDDDDEDDHDHDDDHDDGAAARHDLKISPDSTTASSLPASASSRKKSGGQPATPSTPVAGGDDFDVDPRTLTRKQANKLADKLARRVAKLTEYVAEKERGADVKDSVTAKKLKVATDEIEKRCTQLVAIEQLLAEGEETEVSEMSERRIERFRNDSASSQQDSGSEKSTSKLQSSSSSPKVSKAAKGDKDEKKKSKLATSASTSSRSSSKSDKADKADKSDKRTVPMACGMCGETFDLDLRAPKRVYVPSINGSTRLTACSSCRRALVSDTNVRSTDFDVPNLPVFDVRLVAAIAPSTPLVYENLHVPRYIDNPSCVYVGTEFAVPDVCVTRYKNCGTLVVSTLQRPSGLRLPNSSPIMSCKVVPPYALTYHENETLQLYDVVTCTGETCTLLCGPAFEGETSARTRSIVANERWIVVMSKERVCVWPWRVLLAHTEHESEPVRRMLFGEASDNPRDDFSALDGHRLLVGSNQSFSVFDLLGGNCIFRFNKRLQLQDTVTSSFYGIRFAGESVMTHEQGGVRVWRLSALSSESLTSSLERKKDSKDMDKDKSKDSGIVDVPPLITATTDDTVLSTVYADGEWLIFGDNQGRLRVRSVVTGGAKAGARQGGGSDRTFKLKSLLGGDVDSELVPVEFLNSEKWLDELAAKKAKSAGSKKKEPAAAPAAGASALRKLGSFANKINFIERFGNRVVCAQESGMVSVWDLSKRDADAPILQHQCRGAVRSFAQLFGTFMVAATDRGADDSGESNGEEQFLSVVVCNFGVNRFRTDMLPVAPLPVPADWRALMFIGADVDAVSEKGERSWYWPVVRKFATLADRAKALKTHMICVTSTREDAAKRAVAAVPELSVVTDMSLRAALGELYSPTFTPVWHDWTVESPDATMAILPGAEPFDPLSVMVVINVDGFIKSYSLYFRFGQSTTPAKVWAHVHALVTQASMGIKGSEPKKSGLASLFKKK
jgi:hypothetical protein